ncbi:MAG: hypothetical protein RI917_225 [Actinomycetota bacterium]
MVGVFLFGLAIETWNVAKKCEKRTSHQQPDVENLGSIILNVCREFTDDFPEIQLARRLFELRPKGLNLKHLSAASIAISASLVLSGCTSPGSVESTLQVVEVKASDTDCSMNAQEAKSGNIVFRVENAGINVTEFYVLASDGQTVISEVENIGAQLTRDLVVQLAEGDYFVNCRPGMTGLGLMAPFSVNPGEQVVKSQEEMKLLEEATAEYKKFLSEQAEQLLVNTETFAQLYTEGKDNQARSLYPEARMFWERIEPVAESFGDLDPILDFREADLVEGQQWTGWHRIEKDLWPPQSGYNQLSQSEREEFAELLVLHTKDLVSRIEGLEYEAFQMSNGAKELLDEIATGKVTGEEEIWSSTDLWDFQANIEGAEKIFTLLRPILESKDSGTVESIESKFAEVHFLLDAHRNEGGFKFYHELSAEEIRDLADAVNALAEPISTMTALVVS